jgi:hypothetical protein
VQFAGSRKNGTTKQMKDPVRPLAATKEIEQEITEGTEKKTDAGTDS